MSIIQLERKEQQALTRLEKIEDQFLTITANVLCEEITRRFTSADVITEESQALYAEAYTNAMRFAWLYGHWHINELLNEAIELNQSPQMPFKEALAYLESQVPTTNKNYRQLDANMRLRAFTVAAVSTEHSVAEVQKLYQNALTTGQSSSDTMQQLGQYLEQAGISASNPWYLELHYRNNMMAAYSAGRWSQIENNPLVEYLIYLSVMDDGTTTLCRHLNKTVKPKDDPFWQTYWPPNHHRCRSTVSPLGKAQYKNINEDAKKRSAQITDEKINQSPTMGAEHQFKNSPTQTLKHIPSSLVTQAESFGLIGAITTYSKAQSEKLLNERVDYLTASIISDSALTELPPELQEQASTITQSNNVYFGLGEINDGYQGEIWFFDNTIQGYIWGRASAYNDGELFKITTLTEQQHAELIKNAQSL